MPFLVYTQSMKQGAKSTVYIVARGGIGPGRSRSHEYGQAVLDILRRQDLLAKDLYLHPNGMWTLDGLVTDVKLAVEQGRFVYIAFVGSDGELGDLQQVCEECQVAHSGHGSFHSRLTKDKNNFKKLAKQHGIKSPYAHFAFNHTDHKESAKEIFNKIEIPMIIKANAGSGVEEVFLASSYGEIENLMEKFFNENKDVLAEKLIKGVDVKVLVQPHCSAIHSCVSVDSEIALSHFQLVEVRNQALALHNALGFTATVEYDFIIDKNGAHLLEANSHPDILHSRYSEFWKSLPHTFEEYILSLSV